MISFHLQPKELKENGFFKILYVKRGIGTYWEPLSTDLKVERGKVLWRTWVEAFHWKDKVGNTGNKKEIYKVVKIKMCNNALNVRSCDLFHSSSCWIAGYEGVKIFASINVQQTIESPTWHVYGPKSMCSMAPHSLSFYPSHGAEDIIENQWCPHAY